MSDFVIHSRETAEPGAVNLLEKAEQSFGFIPNLIGILAESPAAVEAYLALGRIFDRSSLSPAERQIVILAASRFNECRYCVAAHTVIANMQGVPESIVKAIRDDEPIEDYRLETLRDFTMAVVEKRGQVSEIDIDEFLAAGFSRAQALEVILGVTFKTLSNYTNHLSDTPLDSRFEDQSWIPAEARIVGQA